MNAATASAAAALALSGCSTDAPLPAGSESFDPISFFAGESRGEGVLDTLIDSPVGVTVKSVGRVKGKSLILDQTIRHGDEPPRVRRWTMQPVDSDRFSGTLTDASGPVQVTTSGPRAHIRYTMKSGFQVKQQIALQADGKTLLNHLRVEMFGLPVATLDETIRKLD